MHWFVSQIVAPHSSLKEDLDGILDEYDGLCLKRKVGFVKELIFSYVKLRGHNLEKVYMYECFCWCLLLR